MRGVVSAGMVSALEELGLARAFDAVYGSSAGAINGAYFLAGQATLGATIYYDDINTREFIDLWRPLRGRPILDLEFFIDDVAVKRKTLDTARLLSSPTPLVVLATDVETADAAAFRTFENGADLLHAMRAGSTMPVVAGGPYTYRGRRYLDASLSQAVPLAAAEADRHTHILVLLTRPCGETRRLSAFDRYYVMPRLRRLSPTLAQRYHDRVEQYTALMARIDSTRTDGTGPAIIGIRPRASSIGRLERRRSILVAAADEGRRVVIDAFRDALSDR